MNSFWARVRESRIVQAVALVFVIVLVGALIVAGASAAATALLVVLVAAGIYLGSLRVLIGSIVISVLLQYKLGLIKETTLLFFPSDKTNSFFEMVQRTELVDTILVIFFFSYLVSFATGCVKFNFFTIRNETKIVKEEEEEGETKIVKEKEEP